MKLQKHRMQIEQYIKVIKLRYNVKREYFTVALPVLAALMLLGVAILTGHGFVPQEGSSSEVMSEEDQRMAAYETLVAEMEAEENAAAMVSDGEEENPPPAEEEAKPETEEEKPKDDLDHIIVFATLIAIIPYSIDTYIQKKRLKSRELAFSEFLFKLSELMRGGVDPIKGVINLSRTDLGALTDNVRDAAAAMVLGHSFEGSMNRLSTSINSRLVSKYIDVVVQAAYTGGNVADLLLRTSEDMRAVITLEREKEATLKQYVVIFYLAQGIIIMLTYILSTSLLPLIQGVGMEMLGGNGLSNIDFERGFFHMILLNGFFGGLIVGVITEGEVKHGLKHTAVLLIMSYLACTALILPAQQANDMYTIELISGGGQDTIGGIPVQEPLVFTVYDLEGNPAPDVFVKMTISPSGMIQSAQSNEEGTVSVTPIVGEASGVYVVKAEVGSATAKATVNVQAGD
ncbi:MAG: type II secretion system F family protein [Halobacteriota archaeon]